MIRLVNLLGTLLLLSTPFALAQNPGQPPNQNPDSRLPLNQRHSDQGRGGHGPSDRDPRGDHMHGDGGPDGIGGLHVPPGTWWRNPETVSRIALTPDQAKRIDGIFLDSRLQLIHMHASLEEEVLRLEPILAANPIDQQAAYAQASKIADTRAELEKANVKMLLGIRGVLSADQWSKLQQRGVGGPHPMDGPGRQDGQGPGGQ